MQTARIACVLEWENAKGLEREQSREVLQDLARQLAEHARTSNTDVELLLIHDDDVTSAAIDEDLASCPELADPRIKVRAISAPGTGYYEKKGIAPFMTDADILVFADSDCLYQPGWVAALSRPLLMDEADVTFGPTEARLEPGVVALTSAIAWTFATPHARDPFQIELPDRFFANNVAVRRKVLDRVPVPRMPGGRVGCGVWRGRLAAEGLRLKNVPEARGRHKQFDSVGDLYSRAWMLGTDRDLSRIVSGRSRGGRLGRGILAFIKQPLRFWRRLALVGPSYVTGWRWPVVFVLGTGFQLVAAMGQTVSALASSAAPEVKGYDDVISRASPSR